MRILGIESTCDETGIAVVENGSRIIKNVVSSSAYLHKNYGGIVPEVAARDQVRVIIPAIREAAVDINLSEIEAVAVACGPGLIGSLLIGVETAKTLAVVWKKDLIAVNHLVGHVYANWIKEEVSKVSRVSRVPRAVKIETHDTLGTLGTHGTHGTPKFPLIALIASGAHTDLVLMTNHGQFRHLGGTLDDAAGEAFDKVARVLGLGYPGGPEIEKIASNFLIRNPKHPLRKRSEASEIRNFKFPRPMIYAENFDFSFSGLKTAVVSKVKSLDHRLTNVEKSEIAFEFQSAVVEVLLKKTMRAARKFKAKSIVIGGGVTANEELRKQLSTEGSRIGVHVFHPKKDLAIDNGAMIAAAAFFTKTFVDPLNLSAKPNLHF